MDLGPTAIVAGTLRPAQARNFGFRTFTFTNACADKAAWTTSHQRSGNTSPYFFSAPQQTQGVVRLGRTSGILAPGRGARLVSPEAPYSAAVARPLKLGGTFGGRRPFESASTIFARGASGSIDLGLYVARCHVPRALTFRPQDHTIATPPSQSVTQPAIPPSSP